MKQHAESSPYQSCISVENLQKYYNNNNVRAVDGISLTVGYGQVFGFLGPNGAGKTTTIKILTSLIRPSAGIVKIFGKDILNNSLEIRRRIGVVLQQPSFESRLTVENALELYGLLWGITNRQERRKKVQNLLNIFDLKEIKNLKIEDLSIGQRRRVQVAREFIHEMDLLFLDEPTVGLDPSARRILLDYIKLQVSKRGLTVFFTTHIMEEAEYLCNEIAIINKGKIVAIDSPAGLKQKYGGVKIVEMKLKKESLVQEQQSTSHNIGTKHDNWNNNYNKNDNYSAFSQSSFSSELKNVLDLINRSVSTDLIRNVSISNNGILRVQSADPQQAMMRITDLLSKHMIQIENISINPTTLEEVFLNIIKKEENMKDS